LHKLALSDIPDSRHTDLDAQAARRSFRQGERIVVTTSARFNTAHRTRVQLAATIVGAVFLLVGILGFVPGVTTHYSDMTFAGHNSMAKLLGVFMVSVLHNLVHIAFGIAGLALARRYASARSYLIAGGVIYLVLWVYGLIIDRSSNANFVPVNTPDNWLHFGLGAGMIALGLLLSDKAHHEDSRPAAGR
jgi:hypothetical protein